MHSWWIVICHFANCYVLSSFYIFSSSHTLLLHCYLSFHLFRAQGGHVRLHLLYEFPQFQIFNKFTDSRETQYGHYVIGDYCSTVLLYFLQSVMTS